MKPGEIINKEGFIELNKISNSITIKTPLGDIVGFEKSNIY